MVHIKHVGFGTAECHLHAQRHDRLLAGLQHCASIHCKHWHSGASHNNHFSLICCCAEEEAKGDHVDQLVLLTTRTADWFEQRGFQHAGPAHASPFLPDSRRQQVQHLALLLTMIVTM